MSLFDDDILVEFKKVHALNTVNLEIWNRILEKYGPESELLKTHTCPMCHGFAVNGVKDYDLCETHTAFPRKPTCFSCTVSSIAYNSEDQRLKAHVRMQPIPFPSIVSCFPSEMNFFNDAVPCEDGYFDIAGCIDKLQQLQPEYIPSKLSAWKTSLEQCQVILGHYEEDLILRASLPSEINTLFGHNFRKGVTNLLYTCSISLQFKCEFRSSDSSADVWNNLKKLASLINNPGKKRKRTD